MLNLLRPILFGILFFTFGYSSSQSRFNLSKTKSKKIRFEFINNLIVIPVQINGVDLSFILDTGVSKPILFNLVNTDSLQIRDVETIFLHGLGGDGSIEAMKSKHNFLKIGDAINVNQDLYVVFNNTINFTSKLGTPVHGIIGYDIFKDFVVELNYSGQYIRLFRPESFNYERSRRWKTIPISVYNKKPYLDASVNIDSDTNIPIKLLIDTGGSDALWLFEDKNLNIVPLKDMYFEDFLGNGLSGAVFGLRSKVTNFNIGGFDLEDVNVAFPDSSSLTIARKFKARNGSVAGNVLKRFNMFFDYTNRKLMIKKNGNYKLPFYYNNSGITIEQKGVRLVKELQKNKEIGIHNRPENNSGQRIDLTSYYKFILKPAFEIVDLREASNAKKVGLLIGDIIISINGKQTHSMTLQQVNRFLYDKEGKLMRLKIDRDGEIMSFNFRLDNVFKKKSPQSEGSLVYN